MTRADVAVVGGGPAGLATAIGARLQGLSVHLFDNARPPIDKACGEGLMPDGVASLERLGIETQSLGRRFVGVRYVDQDQEATGEFPSGYGLGIRRTKLHQALVDRAEHVGAILHWGCRVTGIDEHTIRTTRGTSRADWIVGADGLHSRARQWLGIRVKHGRPRFGLRRHFQIEPWSNLVEVHWGDGCEVYVTPVDDSQVGIAVLRHDERLPFQKVLRRFPVVMQHLRDAPASSRKRGYGPLWALPEKAVSGNVALVGDAAGYLDAITGEGLSIAFHQAEALAEALKAGALDNYQTEVRRLARLPGALIRVLLFVERRPRLRRRLIRTLAREPRLFARILAIHARQLPPSKLGLSNLRRLVRGLGLAEKL